MNDELLDLVLALRASLEDAAQRGAWGEDPDAPLPVVPHGTSAPVQTIAAPAPPAPAPPAPVVPAGAWSRLAADARAEGPGGALTLARVREELGDCRRCPLARTRKSLVFGVGDPTARLVVVGEAPGYHEDQQAEPFVGPAGQMLDKMLENVLGLTRSQVYILNVVKCRPPNNRNPLPEELDACRPFLLGQISAIAPAVLLVLGSVAYKALFQTEAGITRSRGRWHEFEGIPALPTYHPAYLLRTPEDKRLAFEDLKVLKTRYDELVGRQSPAR